MLTHCPGVIVKVPGSLKYTILKLLSLKELLQKVIMAANKKVVISHLGFCGPLNSFVYCWICFIASEQRKEPGMSICHKASLGD